MSFLFGASHNLSYYTIPAAWLLTMAPHAYAVGLYISRSSKPANAFDPTKPRAMLQTLEADQSVDKATKDTIVRSESAHNNGLENLGLFAAAVVAGNAAGVETGLLNRLSWGYVGTRVVYNLVYVTNTTRPTAALRTISFFTGLGLCLALFISAGNNVSGGLGLIQRQ